MSYIDNLFYNAEPHAPTHESGGSDEIDVTGLSGVLATPQTAAPHASTHQHDGSDPIATTTPSPYAIPMANADGVLDLGWLANDPRYIVVSSDPANFQTNLQAAIDLAASTVPVRSVVMPAGEFQMTGEIVFPTNLGQYSGINLYGAGIRKTILKWTAYSGVGFSINGLILNDIDLLAHWDGFTLRADDASSGTGIYLQSCLQHRFSNIELDYWRGTGGIGLHIAAHPTELSINQNLFFDQFYMQTCYIGARIGSWNQGQAIQMVFNNNLYRDLILDGNNYWSIKGGMFQSGVTYSVEGANPNTEGNNSIEFDNCYHEGSATSFLKTYPPAPGKGADKFIIRRLRAGDYEWVVDLEGPNVELVMTEALASPTTGWLRGRLLESVFIRNVWTLAQQDSFTDLDDYTRHGLTVYGANGGVFSGSDSTLSNLDALLAPYSVEIFDPSRETSVVTDGERIVSLTGLLNGSVATAPSATQRPTLKPVKGGMAVACLEANSSTLTTTLATPVAADEIPGVLAVFRAGPTPAPGRVRGVHLGTLGSWTCQLGAADGNETVEVYGKQAKTATANVVGPVAGEAVHVALVQNQTERPGNSPFLHLTVDGTDYFTGVAVQTPPGVPISYLQFCDYDPAYGHDLDVMYVAVLKTQPPINVLNKIVAVAMERFGVAPVSVGVTVADEAAVEIVPSRRDIDVAAVGVVDLPAHSITDDGQYLLVGSAGALTVDNHTCLLDEKVAISVATAADCGLFRVVQEDPWILYRLPVDDIASSMTVVRAYDGRQFAGKEFTWNGTRFSLVPSDTALLNSALTTNSTIYGGSIYRTDAGLNHTIGAQDHDTLDNSRITIHWVTAGNVTLTAGAGSSIENFTGGSSTSAVLSGEIGDSATWVGRREGEVGFAWCIESRAQQNTLPSGAITSESDGYYHLVAYPYYRTTSGRTPANQTIEWRYLGVTTKRKTVSTVGVYVSSPGLGSPTTSQVCLATTPTAPDDFTGKTFTVVAVAATPSLETTGYKSTAISTTFEKGTHVWVGFMQDRTSTGSTFGGMTCGDMGAGSLQTTAGVASIGLTTYVGVPSTGYATTTISTLVNG